MIQVGQKYGKLVVLKIEPNYKALFRCDCGKDYE